MFDKIIIFKISSKPINNIIISQILRCESARTIITIKTNKEIEKKYIKKTFCLDIYKLTYKQNKKIRILNLYLTKMKNEYKNKHFHFNKQVVNRSYRFIVDYDK